LEVLEISDGSNIAKTSVASNSHKHAYNGLDLYRDKSATGKDAYDDKLKHGMTVVRQVITAKTMTLMRNCIVLLNPVFEKEYDVLKPDN
jgi:hypothetical protein